MANHIEARNGIDLVAVAEALPAKFRKLKHLTIRLRDANSVRTDLLSAFDMLLTAEAFRSGEVRIPAMNDRVEIALFYTAVILYARATHTASKGRGKIDLVTSFDELGRRTHGELCARRDSAIAHFDAHDLATGVIWHRDGVYLPLDRPDDIRTIPVSYRRIPSVTELRRFKQHVHRALLLVQGVAERRDHEFVEVFNSSWDDPVVQAIFQRHRVEAADYFGDEETANAILDGARVGSTSGVSDAKL